MSRRQLPTLLVELVESGRWHQPSDELVRMLVPFESVPFDFLLTREKLEADGLSHLLKHPAVAEQFRVYRSGWLVRERQLPWVDVKKALVIADGRVHGSDSAILLDLRTSRDNPAVLASNWERSPGTCNWQVISPSLQQFVQKIEELEGAHFAA